MKNRLLLILVLCFFTSLAVTGQDIILKKTGEEIQAIIIDVSPGVIKYKKFENQDGPIFAIAREQVDKILYQNGKTETFRQEEPEEIEKPDEKRQIEVPLKPSPIFGFHVAWGGSSLLGDFEDANILLATALGASFTLPAGKNNGIFFELDILSVGCGFKDIDYIDDDGNRVEIKNAREDLGLLSVSLLDRYFLNAKRSYFVEGGFNGSVLISANYVGYATITSPQGGVEEGAFDINERNLFNDFDFGIAGGLGGRIPMGKSGKWHITIGARFSYGLTNLLNADLLIEEVSLSNIYGLVFFGTDLQTKTSK